MGKISSIRDQPFLANGIHFLLRLEYFRARQRFFRSPHEQKIWSERSRLVGNAVVCYNALISSEALAELESRGEVASAGILKTVSPEAWHHINFSRPYQFDADFIPDDFTRLRQQLGSEEVSRVYAAADRYCFIEPDVVAQDGSGRSW